MSSKPGHRETTKGPERLIHRSAWKKNSAKFACRTSHETASECPRKPHIPVPTAGRRPQHVVVPHKDTKPCMISGEKAVLEGARPPQNAAEPNPSVSRPGSWRDLRPYPSSSRPRETSRA